MSGVRYTVADQVRARELYAAGWSLDRICDLMEKERGRRPARNTIWCWTDDAKNERQRTARRNQSRHVRMGTATFRWPGVRSLEWRVARMRVLRDAGLSHAAIAKVMTVDFPDLPLTRTMVEGILDHGRVPQSFRRKVWEAA